MSSPFHGQTTISQKQIDFLQRFGDAYFQDPAIRALANELWACKRAKAALVVGSVNTNGETICGPDIDLTPEEQLAIEDSFIGVAPAESAASEKAPYGNDVHYCDNGMRSDGKKRFPVDTAARVKAAWSYAHHKSIMAHYTSEQLSRLHSCIASAWKKLISKDGPPSAQE